MGIPTANELIAQVHRLTGGSMSLDEFYRWYTPYALSAPEYEGESVADALLDIELSFAEFTSGDCTEAELRDEIAEIACELREHAAA